MATLFGELCDVELNGCGTRGGSTDYLIIYKHLIRGCRTTHADKYLTVEPPYGHCKRAAALAAILGDDPLGEFCDIV
jgi:hypothetical protein